MTLLVAIIVIAPALLTFCLAIELLAGNRPLAQAEEQVSFRLASVIIVPAHDEESIIAATLRNLATNAGELACILVVADNCVDATAKIATNMSVEVIERNDHARRGKGYALDFARQHLRADPPDIVIIIDADCAARPGSIERLIQRCTETGRPCQAAYIQTPTPDSTPALQLSTFAFFIKNVVRQRALQRIAGRVHLLGTGMAFPWRLFDQLDLATANIVEDLEIGLELTNRGHPPLSVENALVSSSPASKEDTLDQRRRWEGGYLQSVREWVPRIIAGSLRHGDLRGLWIAVNLLIPPLALLVLIDLGALIAAVLIQRLTGAAEWPLLLLAGTLLFAGLALAAAWASGGSRFISLSGIARIPGYLAWKLPLYLGLARHGAPKEWVRTRREEKENAN
jgi:cellulose synthase/poly-beta-1,6-N-acetylglucosamine synthase-like glycosyltransferase